MRSCDRRFYDVTSYAEVVVKEVDVYGEKIGFVVVFTRENDVYRIVTLYPSRRFMEEIRRKVAFGCEMCFYPPESYDCAWESAD